MPEFNQEQWEKIRFCLDHWDRIEYLRESGLFEGDVALASVVNNFKVNGELQNRHFHFTQVNEEKKFVKELSTGCIKIRLGV